MKSRSTLLFLFLLMTITSRSQSVMPDVIAASGDFFSNSSGQLQWTLGEVMVETYQNTGNTVNQGFHQVFEISTGISTYSSSSLKIFPNPANQFVSVALTDKNASYIISLMDITGKILQTKTSESASEVITFNMENYSGGIYLLKIAGPGSSFNQSFRIIKTN